MATPSGHHRKATGARPIDQVANQCRLIAKRQRVNHPGSLRTARQQRTAKGIGFDGDVDHVFALGKGLQNMVHRVQGRARAFDHHVNGRMAHQGLPIIGHMGGAVLNGFIE